MQNYNKDAKINNNGILNNYCSLHVIKILVSDWEKVNIFYTCYFQIMERTLKNFIFRKTRYMRFLEEFCSFFFIVQERNWK